MLKFNNNGPYNVREKMLLQCGEGKQTLPFTFPPLFQ